MKKKHRRERPLRSLMGEQIFVGDEPLMKIEYQNDELDKL